MSSNILTRKEIYPIDLILKLTLFVDKQTGKDHKMMFDGDLMNMASQRYQLFKLKGITCVSCGIEGKFFAKEKSSGSKREIYHFNLYAIHPETGKEILMTKDHIIPVTNGGGPDLLPNYQVMCQKCNTAKGGTLPDEETTKRILSECNMTLSEYVGQICGKYI